MGIQHQSLELLPADSKPADEGFGGTDRFSAFYRRAPLPKHHVVAGVAVGDPVEVPDVPAVGEPAIHVLDQSRLAVAVLSVPRSQALGLSWTGVH